MKKGSCLKSFNFENMSKDEIIDKYESVLESREIQITDLSMELGKVQEKNIKLEDKIEALAKENSYYKEELNKLDLLLKKKDKFLAQELQNKEHMFMRIEEKELECDAIKKKLKDLEGQLSSGKKKEYNFNIFKELISGSSDKNENCSDKNNENSSNIIKLSSTFNISDNLKEFEISKSKCEDNVNNNSNTKTLINDSTNTLTSIVRKY